VPDCRRKPKRSCINCGTTYVVDFCCEKEAQITCLDCFYKVCEVGIAEQKKKKKDIWKMAFDDVVKSGKIVYKNDYIKDYTTLQIPNEYLYAHWNSATTNTTSTFVNPY